MLKKLSLYESYNIEDSLMEIIPTLKNLEILDLRGGGFLFSLCPSLNLLPNLKKLTLDYDEPPWELLSEPHPTLEILKLKD